MIKPSDFFVGVVDFFAILLPGAALVFLFRPFLIDDVPNNWLPTTSTQSWVLFLVLSYIVGHLLHAMGSKLLDDYVYGPIYLRLFRPSHKRAAKLDPHALENDEEAVKTLLARVRLKTDANKIGTNYYEWCLSDIRVARPAGAAEVDRLQADSKFFRSMVFVFLVAALVSTREAQAMFSIGAFALTIFAIWRFCDLRWTATKRLYEQYLLNSEHRIEKPKGGIPNGSRWLLHRELDTRAAVPDYEIQITSNTSKRGEFTAIYLTTTHPSVFIGEIAIGEAEVIYFEQRDMGSGYLLAHHAGLRDVKADVYAGRWYTNAGESGDFRLSSVS
ncbi:MAG TPA: hypothetical protein VJM12_15875 [Pyrinomonadaceae bacterium]|nr:hypothetical protein [Pyrinomonadaceae bacterium]